MSEFNFILLQYVKVPKRREGKNVGIVLWDKNYKFVTRLLPCVFQEYEDANEREIKSILSVDQSDNTWFWNEWHDWLNDIISKLSKEEALRIICNIDSMGANIAITEQEIFNDTENIGIWKVADKLYETLVLQTFRSRVNSIINQTELLAYSNVLLDAVLEFKNHPNKFYFDVIVGSPDEASLDKNKPTTFEEWQYEVLDGYPRFGIKSIETVDVMEDRLISSVNDLTLTVDVFEKSGFMTCKNCIVLTDVPYSEYLEGIRDKGVTVLDVYSENASLRIRDIIFRL